ncbi:C2H2-type domain-containing protein [Plasmodiophora brassicae]
MCDAVLSSLAELRAHQRSVHSSAQPYHCQVCDKRFFWSGSLSRHMRIHSGSRPYTCRVCNKSFTQSGTLQRHMRTHTGERPHERGLCKRDLATNMVVGCSNGFVGMVPAATSPVASAVSLPVANTGAGGVPLRPRQAAPAASYPVFTVRNVVRRRPGAACRSLRTGGIAAGRDRLPTTLLPDGKLDDAKSIAAARLLESIAIEFARRSQATTEHATVTKVSTTTTFQAVHDRGLSRAALDSRMFHQRRDVGLHASAFVTAKLC